MTVRPVVVAVSNSEQQRETLVIMLEADFDVTAVATATAPIGAQAPVAVVVAGASCRVDAERASQRWPRAGLVLVDPPQSTKATGESAVLASWSDPLSVPEAVARVAVSAPESNASAPISEAALVAAVRSADLALRPNLSGALTLIALLDAVHSSHSIELALRFLGEHLLNLIEELSWMDWFLDTANLFTTSDATDQMRAETERDLADALHLTLAERAQRACCRGIDVVWSTNAATALRCPAFAAEALARFLCFVLLALPPGTLAIDAGDRAVRCRHQNLDEVTLKAFWLAVIANLLARMDTRLRIADGLFSMTRQ